MKKIDQITNGPVSYLNLKCMRYISHLLYFNLTLSMSDNISKKNRVLAQNFRGNQSWTISKLSLWSQLRINQIQRLRDLT